MLDEESDGITQQQWVVVLALVEDWLNTLEVMNAGIKLLRWSIEVWDENDSEM